MDFKKDIIEITQLFEILGYEDERSVLKWCAKHNIPVIKLGLNKFISSQLLTQYIDNQLVIFVNENKNVEKPPSTYEPKNTIAAKYLNKYESASKIKTIGKGKT